MRHAAKELQRGDVFRLHIFGEVLAVRPVADGKRIKISIALQNQNGGLEFLDSGHTLEFICRPARGFHLYDDDDDDDDNEPEPVEPPDGGEREPA